MNNFILPMQFRDTVYEEDGTIIEFYRQGEHHYKIIWTTDAETGETACCVEDLPAEANEQE